MLLSVLLTQGDKLSGKLKNLRASHFYMVGGVKAIDIFVREYSRVSVLTSAFFLKGDIPDLIWVPYDSLPPT